MKKTFLAAALVLLTIVSLATLTPSLVFDHMQLTEYIPGFKAPVQDMFNKAGIPPTSPLPLTFPTGSSPRWIGCSSVAAGILPSAPDTGFTDNSLLQSSSLLTSSPFSGFPSRVTEDTGPALTPSSGYKLYDTFDSLRSNLWTVSSYKPNSDTLTTTFIPSRVWFSDGRLVLQSSVADNTGGEYKSNDKFYHGKYRAHINVDLVPGTFLTFFAYVWPSDQGNNVHNEIDIELIINRGKATAMLSTWRDYVKTQYLYELPFDPSADYHTYGFDWYADRVEFYIDDMSTPVWTSRSNIPQDPMYVYFNNWVDRNPPASQRNAVSTEYVDWVTVE